MTASNFDKVRRAALARGTDARALARLVEADAFAKAWSVATDAEREEVSVLLAGVDRIKAEAWMRQMLARDAETMPLRQLREMAKHAGVPYYSHKTREEILKELAPKKDAS